MDCSLLMAVALRVRDVSAFLVMPWIVSVAMKLLLGHSYSVTTKAAYIRAGKKHAAHSLKLIIVCTYAIHFAG